ncbi:hypothetical protein JW979_09850 [bacterium]|nr:hypothetical protein [candidate division CSSED10-310 bacterium]
MRTRIWLLTVVTFMWFGLNLVMPQQVVKADSLMFKPSTVDTELWTVRVRPYTHFIPADQPPGDFQFEDLQIGMPVLVQGWICQYPPVICATHVFVFFDGPPPRNDYMSIVKGGIIVDIDYVNGEFILETEQQMPEFRDVLVTMETRFYQAFLGDSLIEIPFDMIPNGAPVMVHGHREENNLIVAEGVILSDDWLPDYNHDWSEDIVEVFGIVDCIDHYQHRMRVFVENLGSNQTYSGFVNQNGGLVAFPWGHLEFPPNAVDEEYNIFISGDFMFWFTLQNVYLFGPEGLTFNEPVLLEIRYFNLDGIDDPERVSLSYYDDELGKWRVYTHMDFFPEHHCFRGYINHFSRYSLSTNGRPVQFILEQ